ncbi:MAG: hypothetical protein BRD55_01325 [Bacteroidetes bacterium SW_9_63_38]|nr:MAG: hypothetical protein BRD55_01325 [Bacteroidetes bacterium SW_9_63_38]
MRDIDDLPPDQCVLCAAASEMWEMPAVDDWGIPLIYRAGGCWRGLRNRYGVRSSPDSTLWYLIRRETQDLVDGEPLQFWDAILRVKFYEEYRTASPRQRRPFKAWIRSKVDPPWEG